MNIPQVWIRDLESAFGTYVNDIKIKTATTLKAGDIVVRRPLFVYIAS